MKKFALILSILLFSGVTAAQQRVFIQGQDAEGEPRIVKTDALGRLTLDLSLAMPVTITGPLGVRAEAGAVSIAPPNDAYFMISKDGNANLTGNRIWIKSDVDMLGGFAIDLGTGNVAPGTARYTLADDDPAVASLAIIAGDTTSLNTKITVEDLDTVGTDNRQVVGLVVQSASGARLVGTTDAPLFVSMAGSTYIAEEEGPTATDGTPDEVFGSIDISQSDSWGVHIWNDGGGGNPLTDADVQVSRDGGATFFSLTWTECDGLVDTDDCDYDYPFNSFTHVKVYTTSAAGTTVTVQVSARPGVLGP